MARMIPTSADIYLEINGVRVAVVQSYSVTTTRSSKVIEAFGQEEPVATIAGANQYVIELSRLYAPEFSHMYRKGDEPAPADSPSSVLPKAQAVVEAPEGKK